jgi:3-oxoacyl-[acyl-carrier protein] reductase
MKSENHPEAGEADAPLTRADVERLLSSITHAAQLNLRFRNLRRIDLSYLDLQGINLQGANLEGANLRGTNLREASLQEANLSQADFDGADLSRVRLGETKANRARLQHAKFSYAILRELNLCGFDLSELDLRNADLNGTDLRGAVLRGTNLQGADLSTAQLNGPELSGAILHQGAFWGTREERSEEVTRRVQIASQRPTRRLALVTGASRARGIGAAICLALARAGVDIFFTHWSPYDQHMPWGAEEDEPALLQKQIQALGVRCEHLMIDLGAPEAPQQIIQAAQARLGPVSILINNATHDDTEAPFDQLDAATLDAYYAVNMRGTMLLTIEFARQFALPSGGRIINLTSGQGRGPMPGKLAYVATKGAIEAFTVTLAAEVAPRGITVNAVDPGPTDTGWMTDAIKREFLIRFPMGRLGQPEDAARLIAFLASEDAQWITGQIIHSTGGF